MTDVQLYVFPPTGQQLRTVLVDGAPQVVAADVCAALGLGRHQDSTRYLDDDEKGTCLVDTPSGSQQMTTVTESGLYSLILRSRKPEARAFKRWVTHDVLPAIRKTGRYELVSQRQVPQSFAEALELAAAQAREIEAQRSRLDWAEPRATYVDRFVDGGEDATTVRDLAKELGEQEKRLREWMIERGLIYRERSGEYKPRAQVGPRRHWFALRDQPEAPRLHNGQVRKTLYVTPAGKVGIADLLGKYPLTGQSVLVV